MAVLDGDVQIGEDVPRAGHRRQQVVADRGGVAVENPDPEAAGEGVERAQQPGQARRSAPVAAVAG